MLHSLGIAFCCSVAFLSVSLSCATAAPNLLIILPDQMRGSAMGCDGNKDVQTPHIDQLAAEGMLFKRTYANVPVCCPARSILLTGTYPHANGMMANDLRLKEEHVTIAERLQKVGYRTGFIGKWHLDGGPREPGFVPPGERRQGFEFWAAYECHHKHFEPDYFRDTPERIVVQKFEPEASCDFAVEFLRSQPKEKPFFLTVQMGPPHDPYGAPEEYTKLYDERKITPDPSWVEGSETRPMPKGGLRRGPLASRFVKIGSKQEILAYYAAITALDAQVGRLLATLKETGVDENTIILFTSDHGDMLGNHGMRRKRKPHDESARVPGIIRWPGKVPQGRAVDTLFSHVDMAPTLLALAGQEVPKEMQGADLSQVALGKTTAGPEAVLLQLFVPFDGDMITHPWRGIVTAQHTYARYKHEPWVLFDHQTDPHQMKNLANENPALLAKMDEQLTALMKKNGDAWSFGTHEHIEDGGRLYKDGVFYSITEYQDWQRAHPEVKP
jgi:arylsulfatase A-like enzyme